MKKVFTVLAAFIFVISVSEISFSQDIPVRITPVGKNDVKKINSVRDNNGQNGNSVNLVNTTVLPGNGSTSGNGRAPMGSRRFINTKYIISGAEMTTSGFGSNTVTSVGWRYNVPGAGTPTAQSVATTGRLIVYLRDTLASATTIGGTFIDTTGAGYTKIIDGTISIPADVNEINIDVPTGGPGTSNFTTTAGNGVVLIFVYTTYDAVLSSTNPIVYCTNTPAGALLTAQSNTITPAGQTGASSGFRPETRLGYTPLNNDVGAFTNSLSGQVNSPPMIAPKGVIKNFGALTQGPFDVSCVISGPTPYSSTKTVATLNSGSTTTVTFDSTFLPTPGSYSMKITTLLAGDQVPGNDTLTTFFTAGNFNYGGGGVGTGGYFYSNSIPTNGSPSEPTYSWIDPVAAGHTAITFADPDDGTFPVDIGFNFTYMGTTYNTGATNLNIYTNGFLNLGAAVSGAFYGVTSFPNAGNPANLISPGLIDLDLTPANYPTAKVYYGGDASKFVVTYFHAYRWVSTNNSTDYVTMQVIFYPNGNIRFQYNDAESFNYFTTFTPFCDIGMQDGTGTLGVQYRVDGSGGPMFSSPVAVEFGLDQNSLPVELSSFTSNIYGRNVELKWSTVSELNNSGFDIERKVTGTENWSKMGNVAGNGTSNNTHNYSYNESNLNSGKYNYRLKQIDFNGNYKYYNLSNEVIIGVPSKFELAQNYPNPFNPSTKINYDLPFDSKVSIKLFDMTGREVASVVNQAQVAGYYTVNFNASSLSSGVYFYKINAEGGNQSFTKTLKMMLVK